MALCRLAGLSRTCGQERCFLAGLQDGCPTGGGRGGSCETARTARGVGPGRSGAVDIRLSLTIIAIWLSKC